MVPGSSCGWLCAFPQSAQQPASQNVGGCFCLLDCHAGLLLTPPAHGCQPPLVLQPLLPWPAGVLTVAPGPSHIRTCRRAQPGLTAQPSRRSARCAAAHAAHAEPCADPGVLPALPDQRQPHPCHSQAVAAAPARRGGGGRWLGCSGSERRARRSSRGCSKPAGGAGSRHSGELGMSNRLGAFAYRAAVARRGP